MLSWDMRQKRAEMQSPQYKRMKELKERVLETRHNAEQAVLKERIAFQLWEEADNAVRTLERIRDDNMPKSPNEEWNERFCLAIQLLPDAIERAEDLWFQYTGIRL